MRIDLLATSQRAPLYRGRGSCCRIWESGPSYGRHLITIVTHEDPIGRGPTNYMIHADLSDRQDGWREQLWTRQLTEDTFEVACLPFFTYGICYRDVVTIGSNHLVNKVVHKSGHRTLRVALVVEHADRDHAHELLHGKAVDTGLPHEWLRGTYLAIDLPPGSDEAPFVETLEPLAQAGTLHWEIDS